MASKTPGDTSKARNIALPVDPKWTVEEMGALLSGCADELGLIETHVTTLSKKKYPGNRHWHYKQIELGPGCLDVTHWPGGGSVWITVRNREPQWVHDAGDQLATALSGKL